MLVASKICGYIALVFASVGLVNKKQTFGLITQIIANAAIAASYALLGKDSISGGVICFIAVFQTLINYFLLKDGKKLPLGLFFAYFGVYTGATVLTAVLSGSFRFPIALIPYFCAILYLLATSTSSNILFRVFFFANSALWVLFDVLTVPFSFPNLLTHLVCLGSSTVGFIRVFRAEKNAKAKEPENAETA